MYDDEFEMVDYAVHAKKIKECEHKFHIQVIEGITHDGRKKKTEVKTCRKCGTFTEKQIWSEPIPSKIIRGC